MKIKVFCSKCNKYDIIEREAVDKQENSDDLFIPIPGAKNGLTTYSIAHNDHTLVVDIDADGNVRGEQIIDRIGQELESILTAIAQRILFRVYQKNNLETTFIFITRNIMLEQILLGTFQHMIFNRESQSQIGLSINHNSAIMEYDNINVYVGQYADKIYSLINDNPVLILHLYHDTSDEILRILRDLKPDTFNKIILLFDSEFIKTEDGKNTLNEIMMSSQVSQVLDASEPMIAAKTLFSVIDNYFHDLLGDQFQKNINLNNLNK